jgi:hypothetical protein
LCRRLRIAALPGKGTVLRVASDHVTDERDALPGGIMTRNVRHLLAALALAAATGTGGYLAGSSTAENADWHTGTARVMGEPEDPEITAHDDDWDYAATGDVDWIDKFGTQHTGDTWPACLPVVPTDSPRFGDEYQIRFASVKVKAEGMGWRPIVMIDCRP